MKKALLFDPYLDTLGGGERYFLSFALGLKGLGHEVTIAWNNDQVLSDAQKRFGLDLSGLSISPQLYNSCSSRSSLMSRFKFTHQFDLIFWISDGSLPFLFGKNNLVHFQVPFTKLGGNPMTNSLKLGFIHRLIYNSEFTRNVIEISLPQSKGVVLYPPIDTEEFKPGKKEKLILSVARFGSPSHSKRQDILVEAFREFSSKVKGFRLVLAGGHKGDGEILNDLKQKSKGLSVEIVPNPDFDDLKKLYAKATFFWHAAGYDVDEVKEPEKVEHFGITTVEAMSAGCVPVVIAKGGQKEILSTIPALLVTSPEDMSETTLSIIEDNKISEYSQSVKERAKIYSQKNFIDNITTIIS